MAVDAYLRATYEDGFVLIEDEADQSPYDAGANIFHAILHGRPCEQHGNLVSLELVTPEQIHRIDWRDMPDNARPIRFKNMQATQVGDGPIGPAEVMSISFGYQFTDTDGHNVQEVTELS